MTVGSEPSLDKREVTILTGVPELVGPLCSPTSLYRQSEYLEALRWGSANEDFDRAVPIRDWGGLASEHALYGTVAVARDLLTFVIVPRDQGHELTLDVNGNGDLSDDARRPMSFGRELASKPVYETTFDESYRDHRLQLRISYVPSMRAAFRHRATVRRGVVRLGDADFAFALLGWDGRYDTAFARVFFDTDQDGELDVSDRSSEEAYRLSNPIVALGDDIYRFSIASNGDSLTVSSAPEERPRVSLEVGAIAPTFSFVDMEGDVESLDHFHGKVTLLYFWTTWCAPCKAHMPDLVALHRSFREQGFEILGVNAEGEPSDRIARYTAEMGIPWKQATPVSPSEVKELYRVAGYPTFVLIDRTGAIATRARTIPEIDAEVGRLVRTGVSLSEEQRVPPLLSSEP